jgi:hypothetical protein
LELAPSKWRDLRLAHQRVTQTVGRREHTSYLHQLPARKEIGNEYSGTIPL